MLVHYGLSIVFGILSVIDYKRKYFKRGELIFAVLVILLTGISADITVWNRLAGGLLGCILVGFSILSGEQLGKGDAILLLVCGCVTGIYYMTALLTLTFAMTAVVGGVLLGCKKIKKTTRLPFLPFLFVAQLILCNILVKTGNIAVG